MYNSLECIDSISLIHGDCMDYMRTLPDNTFELAIVDPPYGIKHSGQRRCVCKNKRHNRKYFEDMGWDNSIPPIEYFKELQRVSVNQIIWGGNYFVPMLDKGTKGWIVWDKGQHGLSMSDCELAYSSFNRVTRVVVINRCELAKEGTIHPTQKPIKLYTWILNNYAKPGNRIIDTHLGSGSSAIAAYKLGFEFVGIEIEEKYYNGAVDRLKRYIANSQPAIAL